MPIISRFYGIVIKIFFEDHYPPHFHAEYQGDEALFKIETLEMIKGYLPRRAKAMVVKWALKHKKELIKNWKKAKKPESLDNIEPLV